MGYKVIKHSGEEVLFEKEKLKISLINSGANEGIAQSIADEVETGIYPGISTRKIYEKAHRLLKSSEKNKASRYGLKKAILDLGPTGYPFELFVAELVRHEGFEAQVGNVMPGRCVTHEVDVFAYNENTLRMMECKFHNRLGYKTDVKVPMYIKSRFEDLAAIWSARSEYEHKRLEGWVVTNSRFTKDAIDFARCSGLKVLSWDYPNGHSLKELIERHHLYPVTSLTRLTKTQRDLLMSNGVILAKKICETPDVLLQLGIEQAKTHKIVEEAAMLCEI